MYADIEPALLRVIEPIATDRGLEIVDATLSRIRGGAQVRVVLDTPAGDGRVDVEECARALREFRHALDASDAVPSSYSLEVCSPGVDRVLGRPVDFERSVGREVALETREKLGGRRRFRGALVAFDGSDALLEIGAQRLRIPFASIARAQAFYPFDSPGSRR